MKKNMVFCFMILLALAVAAGCAKNEKASEPTAPAVDTNTFTMTCTATDTGTPTNTPTVTETFTTTLTPTRTATATTTTVQIRCAALGCYVADAGIVENSASNFGSSTVNSAGFDGANKRRILIKFDLSSIPSTAQVTDARIVVTVSNYFGAGASFNLSAHTVNSAWDEAVETWSTHSGGDFNPAGQGSTAVSSTGSWVVFLTPSVVQQWASGALANNGLLIKQETENTVSDYIVIYMKEAANESDRPYLQVTYR
jgi:hypothetical protein